MLCPDIFYTINGIPGPLKVDLFTSRLMTQLPSFVSWRPDPEAMATDTFTTPWTGLRLMQTRHGAWWGGEGSGPSLAAESGPGTGGTSLEKTDVVPDGARDPSHS